MSLYNICVIARNNPIQQKWNFYVQPLDSYTHRYILNNFFKRVEVGLSQFVMKLENIFLLERSMHDLTSV